MPLTEHAPLTRRSLRLIVTLLTLLILALTLTPASAAVFDIPCGNTAALATAIATSNTNGQADTINLGSCTYLPFTILYITADGGNPVTINGGQLTGSGAVAIFIIESGANVTINNMLMTLASSAQGSAIHLTSASLTLSNVGINSSTATNGMGGAIYSLNSQLVINNAFFGNNKAQGSAGGTSMGGAIAAIGGTTTITGTRFHLNVADDGGGAIYNTGTLTLNNTELYENVGGDGGGAIYNTGTLILNRTALYENTAALGGGIWNSGSPTAVTTLTNSNVHLNSAQSGGGLYNQNAQVALNNSIVASNSATVGGGGIFNSTSVTASLKNSIIADSTSGGDCSGGTVTAQYTLIEDGSCGITHTIDGNRSGDPNLATGDAAHIVPLPGSIAINAGDNTLIPAGVTTDIAGSARIIGGIVDMGSYETTFVPDVTISPAAPSVNEGSNTSLTLTRTEGTSAAFTVSLNITLGTDANTSDYTLSGGSISGQSGVVTVTIPAGQPSVTINFAAVNDFPAEAAETVTLTLVDGADYNLGTPAASTVTIAQNDFFVTTFNDAGEGSLRQAVLNANAFPSDDTITFNFVGGTITLTSGELLISNNGSLTISGSSVTVSGGGTVRPFHIQGTVAVKPTVTISTMIITGSNNSGIFIENANVTLNTVRVAGNSSPLHGGGILLGGPAGSVGSLTVNNSSITGNTAGSLGGGILTTALQTLTINNSTIRDNTLPGGVSGGGITFYGAQMTITNSTITGNSAPGGGGGIWMQSPNVVITNTTFTGNSAPTGGGIYMDLGSVTLRNSIVANSTGADCAQGAGTFTVNHSLVEDGTCGVGTGPVYANGNLSGDPKLGALLGGPGYFPLGIGSIAINAGNNALIPAGVTTDQPGNARIINGTVDMGSYEFPPIGNVTIQLTQQSRPPAPHASRVTVNHVEVRPTGGGAAILTGNYISDNQGRFTVSGLPVGSYNIWIKGTHTLARVHGVTLVIGSNNLTTDLMLEGDANDDNIVALVDFSLLATAFGTQTGDAAFDARADFNQDGLITLPDFSLLASNFSLEGAP